MRKTVLSSAYLLIAGACAFAITACGDDDNSVSPGGSDAGSEASARDATADDGGTASDAGSDGTVSPDDAALVPPPPYLLMTYSFANYAKSAYAAYSLSGAATAGSLAYSQYGVHVNGATSPWVLEGVADLALKMDPVRPWDVASSWSVAAPKTNDAGTSSSNAFSVTEAGGKAYVALFNRNAIAVLDTTQAADGGAPLKLIDVSKWVQPQDGDGYVDMTDIVFVASENRVYVSIGNIDLGKADPNGFFLLCDGAKSALGAIDTTTDTIVDLGDPGVSNGALPLAGVGPLGLTYDKANARLLVLSAGCNEPPAADAGPDAGAGALRGRVIEEVSLATKATRVLLAANGQEGYPGKFVYIDGTHAFATFGNTAYAWNPTTLTLGAALPTAPDVFAYDGNGALVGPKVRVLSDGGFGSVDILKVRADDGGVTVIGQGAIPTPPDYFESVTIWPTP